MSNYLSNYFALSQAYTESVNASRHTMGQMLNIMRDQDRAMRETLRDAERAFTRADRSRFNSPIIHPHPSPLSGIDSHNTYNIPYAPPPRPMPSWNINSSPPFRPTVNPYTDHYPRGGLSVDTPYLYQC